jgi:hypothetical protein
LVGYYPSCLHSNYVLSENPFNLLKISYRGLCSHSAGDGSFHRFFLAFGALVLWTTSTGFFDIFLFSGI